MKLPDMSQALKRLLAIVMMIAGAAICAQTPASGKKLTPSPSARKQEPAPAAKPIGAPVLAGKGWRVAARPAWVVEPAGLVELTSTPLALAPAGNGIARRDLLVDIQSNYALPNPQSFVRLYSVATEASTLGALSQPQITFNPAFQTVVLHEARLVREGRELDRLGDARIELLRRERQLEQSVLDGTETLLVLLNDVRVGDIVELSYTIEGENPIYEGRISTGSALAFDTPVSLLNYRLTAPADRMLQVKTMAGSFQADRVTQAGLQVISLTRSGVAAVPQEQNIPPWFRSRPSLLISEYANWAEVNAWAQRLFPRPVVPNAGLAERVAAFRASAATGEQLASDVLRFVQDEVRYFSVSLGESSHRPKAPERTLAERMGDCKDKVVLLNALLTELGFDAKPALVATRRNRGLVQFLPSHDEFDHVITRLDLNGNTYYLDATINGQGTTLATRGYYPYGSALVVGGDSDIQAVVEPPQALNRLEYEQAWDLSRPGAGASLKTVLRAYGLTAERYRSALEAGAGQRLTEALAGAQARIAPGLRTVGTPKITDDRAGNQLEISQTFEHPDPGRYARGALDVDLVSIELADVLSSPTEARRSSPLMFDPPRTVESRIVVTNALPFTARPPPAVEVNDRHFRLSVRYMTAGNTVTVTRRIERRSDEVLPDELETFRENLLKARQLAGGNVRLALLDGQALKPQFEAIDSRLRNTRGFRPDALHGILLRNEVDRLFDTEVLRTIDLKSPLAAHVLASRAQANNLLGDFRAGLADAQAALLIDKGSEAAQEALGVALVGANRGQDALAAFTPLKEAGRSGRALHWMGAIELMQGRPEQAEPLLRGAVDASDGEGRDFAILWLYLAAEQQGGRGNVAIAPYLPQADTKKLPGALLHYFAGRIDQDTVLKLARENRDMERLNLAEANFYIGQQAAARGKREDALQWFKRAVETGAVPYREVTFAQLQIERGR